MRDLTQRRVDSAGVGCAVRCRRPAGLRGVLAAHAQPAHRQYFQAFQRDRSPALLARSVGATLEAIQRGVNVGEGGHCSHPDGGRDMDPRLVGYRDRSCGLGGELVELLHPELPLLFES
jgi:hypothetical protein